MRRAIYEIENCGVNPTACGLKDNYGRHRRDEGGRIAGDGSQ
jgi:hypothetical protein